MWYHPGCLTHSISAAEWDEVRWEVGSLSHFVDGKVLEWWKSNGYPRLKVVKVLKGFDGSRP